MKKVDEEESLCLSCKFGQPSYDNKDTLYIMCDKLKRIIKNTRYECKQFKEDN